MKNELLNALATLLAALISVATPFLILVLKNLANQLKAKTNSELAHKYIDEFDNAVTTAVTAVTQTYVDDLKKENAFSKENQEEALYKAKMIALQIMTEETKTFITNAYGDLPQYLTAKIEQTVRAQKEV